MKLAITKTANFPFTAAITREGQAINVVWRDKNGLPVQDLSLTEEFIREHCGERELGDCANVYLEADSNMPSRLIIHNKMAATLWTKNGGVRHLKKNQRLCFGQVYIPFASSQWSEWAVRLNCKDDSDSLIPEDAVEVPCSEEAFAAFSKDIWPTLQILEVQKLDDERSSVAVQLHQKGQPLARPGVRVFAKSATGYLPKCEVCTDENGVARFIARRLDLTPDDGPMVVEFGFKFLTNIVSAHV